MLNFKNESIIYMSKKMWNFWEWHRKSIVLFIIMAIIWNILTFVPPVIFWALLNEIQKSWVNENNINSVFFMVGWLLLVTLFFWLMHWTSRVLETEIWFKIRNKYREFLFNKLLSSDLSWHSERQSWEIIDKITKASWWLFTFVSRFFEVNRMIVKWVWIIIILAYFDIKISIIFCIVSVFIFMILYKMDKVIMKNTAKENQMENIISAKIYDTISNITSILILNIWKLVSKDVYKTFEKPFPFYSKATRINEIKWTIWDLLVNSAIIWSLLLFIYKETSTNWVIALWTLSALYMYLSKFQDEYYRLAKIYSGVMKMKVDVENAKEIEDKIILKKEKKIIKNIDKIDVENLSFEYEDDNKYTLKNLNLDIKRWEKIALIWHSWSGKTTFLKILHWLYKSDWNIKINNSTKFESFDEINLKTMLVPQEPELFTASILENMTFGLDFKEEDINKALEISKFDEVLEFLPNWLQSRINEKWVNLSWWQKQRLALARAILFVKDKEIILFDESTSSVDSQNEAIIYEKIISNFENKTIISTIHKLNLLSYFDRIIMFDKGEIVADGSFEKLLETNKEFKKMWKSFEDKIKRNK